MVPEHWVQVCLRIVGRSTVRMRRWKWGDMIQLDEQMCYWVNRSVVGWCWVNFSLEQLRGSRKKKWKQM